MRKRNRKRLVMLAAFVLSLGIAYVILWAWFHAGKPTLSQNFAAIRESEFAGLGADDRAWPEYQRLHTILGEGDGQDIFAAEGIEPGEENWPRLRALVVQRRGAIDELRKATKLPRLAAPIIDPTRQAFEDDLAVYEHALEDLDNPFMLTWTVSSLVVLRSHARWLSADAVVAAEGGDYSRSVDDFLAMERLAEHSREPGIIIADLVADAIHLKELGTIRDVLAGSLAEIESDDLARLLEALDGSASRTMGHSRLRESREVVADIAQRVFTDDGEGSGRITDEGYRLLDGFLSISDEGTPWLNPVTAPFLMLVAPSRAEFMADADRYLEAAEEFEATPYLLRDSTKLDQTIDPFAKGRGISGMLSCSVLRIFQAPLANIFNIRDARLLETQSVMAVLAAELYRREHGVWPGTLEDLVPGRLETLPTDPFTGDPLLYQRTAEGFVLYSVGPDLDDDSGVPAPADGFPVLNAWLTRGKHDRPDGDLVLWPMEANKDTD